MMPGSSIKEVLKKHADGLMEVPGVVAVGEGEWQGKPCIRVLVSNPKSHALGRIPSTIEDYPVLVEESGEFRALGN